MSDLIRREDTLTIIERLRDRCDNDEMSFALNWAANIIRDMTAVDAVPVVRCGDCKNGVYSEYYGNVVCTAHLWVRGPKYYCADGKRREDGDT